MGLVSEIGWALGRMRQTNGPHTKRPVRIGCGWGCGDVSDHKGGRQSGSSQAENAFYPLGRGPDQSARSALVQMTARPRRHGECRHCNCLRAMPMPWRASGMARGQSHH
jgi:hypothetical protein